MGDRTYGAEEKAKLERLVNEGVTVLQEIGHEAYSNQQSY